MKNYQALAQDIVEHIGGKIMSQDLSTVSHAYALI